MNKKLLWLILPMLVMTSLVAFLICNFFPNDKKPSDLQRLFAESCMPVAYMDMPSMRSEIFPVQGHENGMSWKIASIGKDDVFFKSLRSEGEAQACYAASIGDCKDNSLFLCGCDIIYYRGNNQTIVQTLRKSSNATLMR